MAYEIPKKEDIAVAEANLQQKQAKFEKMKSDFVAWKDELESNFATNLPKLLDEKTSAILDSGTPVEQWGVLSGLYRTEVIAKIDEARDALEKFSDEVEADAINLENSKNESEIAEGNPDLDFEAFTEWINRDVTPRMMEELRAGAKNQKELITSLIAKYKELNSTEDKPKDKSKEVTTELPKDMTNIAGTATTNGAVDTNSKFLAQAGIYK